MWDHKIYELCVSYLHTQEWDIICGLKVLAYQVSETYRKYYHIAFLLKIQEKLSFLKTPLTQEWYSETQLSSNKIIKIVWVAFSQKCKWYCRQLDWSKAYRGLQYGFIQDYIKWRSRKDLFWRSKGKCEPWVR